MQVAEHDSISIATEEEHMEQPAAANRTRFRDTVLVNWETAT